MENIENGGGDSGDGAFLPARTQLGKLSYSHDAMVDVLVANPGISQQQLAHLFGYSASWICTIIASDAFKAKLASRRTELVDPTLTLSIEEKFKALAEVSVEKLLNHLNTPGVAPDILVKAAALGAKAAGIGGNAPTKLVISSEERLKGLSDRLTNLLNNKREGIIDVQATEVQSQPLEANLREASADTQTHPAEPGQDQPPDTTV